MFRASQVLQSPSKSVCKKIIAQPFAPSASSARDKILIAPAADCCQLTAVRELCSLAAKSFQVRPDLRAQKLSPRQPLPSLAVHQRQIPTLSSDRMGISLIIYIILSQEPSGNSQPLLASAHLQALRRQLHIHKTRRISQRMTVQNLLDTCSSLRILRHHI